MTYLGIQRQTYRQHQKPTDSLQILMAQLCQPSACVFSWLDPVSFLWRQILWVVTHIGWIVQAAHAGVLKPVKAARQKYAEEENWSVKSTRTRIKIRLSSNYPVHHRHSNVDENTRTANPLCQPMSISNVIAQSFGFGNWQTQLWDTLGPCVSSILELLLLL